MFWSVFARLRSFACLMIIVIIYFFGDVLLLLFFGYFFECDGVFMFECW